MTKQMLLNSKRLDKLVLHNECGLSIARFVLSLFACNVPSELKRVVALGPITYVVNDQIKIL